MAQDFLPLFASEIIDQLDPVLRRAGFERHDHTPSAPLRIVELEPLPAGDDLLAYWTRSGSPWREQIAPGVVDGDGASVWQTIDPRCQPGYINVGISRTFARFEWRRTTMDPAELAHAVGAWISRVDDFDPPAHREHAHQEHLERIRERRKRR